MEKWRDLEIGKDGFDGTDFLATAFLEMNGNQPAD
jgi:hypothetical protein